MEEFLGFVKDNYIWFIIIGVLLVMALIGFIAEKTNFGDKIKIQKKEKPKKELKSTKEEKPKKEETKKNEKKEKKNKKEKEVVETEDKGLDLDSIGLGSLLGGNSDENSETMEDLTVPFGDLEISQLDESNEDLTVPFGDNVEESIVDEGIIEEGISDLETPVIENTNEDIIPKVEEEETVTNDDEDVWKF